MTQENETENTENAEAMENENAENAKAQQLQDEFTQVLQQPIYKFFLASLQQQDEMLRHFRKTITANRKEIRKQMEARAAAAENEESEEVTENTEDD